MKALASVSFHCDDCGRAIAAAAAPGTPPAAANVKQVTKQVIDLATSRSWRLEGVTSMHALDLCPACRRADEAW